MNYIHLPSFCGDDDSGVRAWCSSRSHEEFLMMSKFSRHARPIKVVRSKLWTLPLKVQRNKMQPLQLGCQEPIENNCCLLASQAAANSQTKPNRLKQKPSIYIYTEIPIILWTSTVDNVRSTRTQNRSLSRLEISEKKINIHVLHCFLFAFRVNIKRSPQIRSQIRELHWRRTRHGGC